MAAIPLEKEIHYPESDGEPMAETEPHLEEMVYVWESLKDHFAAEPDVFVGANLFLYYRKGDPAAVVAPDGFVVKGVPKLLPGNRRRRKYLLWEEGPAPCFVLETTSASTRREKRGTATRSTPSLATTRAGTMNSGSSATASNVTRHSSANIATLNPSPSRPTT